MSIGVAILCYRLYDIDLFINRALIYASLTALLAVAYYSSVGSYWSSLSNSSAGQAPS